MTLANCNNIDRASKNYSEKMRANSSDLHKIKAGRVFYIAQISILFQIMQVRNSCYRYCMYILATIHAYYSFNASHQSVVGVSAINRGHFTLV